jgi:hypothetical protein
LSYTEAWIREIPYIITTDWFPYFYHDWFLYFYYISLSFVTRLGVIDKEIFSLLNTIDLCQHGFVLGYEVWRFYGELGTQAIEEEEEDYSIGFDRMDEMLEAI